MRAGILLLVCLLVIGGGCGKIQKNKQAEDPSPPLPVIELHEMFFEENNFISALRKADKIEPEKNIEAIVVPHHLLASEYAAGLMKAAGGREIKNIIIIGPNHANLGNNVFATGKAEWQAPEKNVAGDSTMVDSFASKFKIVPDENFFTAEHSVGAMMPFISHYFAQAKVVPIIINSYARFSDAEKLAMWLKENINDKTLIIVSVDFSHYLSKFEADKKDERTRGLIEDMDAKAISELDNTDNVDSPVSLATIILLAKEMNWKQNIVYHGNAYDFMIEKPSETTSYFGIKFTN